MESIKIALNNLLREKLTKADALVSFICLNIFAKNTFCRAGAAQKNEKLKIESG